MKKASFTLLEVILAISIIALMYSSIINGKIFKLDKLQIATDRLLLYLKQTRLEALNENHYSLSDNNWHKKRWQLKFFNCENKNGIYYVIFSDRNKKGHPNQEEALKDSLTNKYIYSSNSCTYTKENSKYVLLTKEYDIIDVNVSCNSSKSKGAIIFGNDSEVYTKLIKETDPYKYKINKPCEIELVSKDGRKKTIIVYNKTAYSKEK